MRTITDFLSALFFLLRPILISAVIFPPRYHFFLSFSFTCTHTHSIAQHNDELYIETSASGYCLFPARSMVTQLHEHPVHIHHINSLFYSSYTYTAPHHRRLSLPSPSPQNCVSGYVFIMLLLPPLALLLLFYLMFAVYSAATFPL
jgi:hypothetical protein